MGNNSSKGGGSAPPSTPASPQVAASSEPQKKGKDFGHVHSSKTAAAAPTASLESASGQSSYHRATGSRGRSQTTAAYPQKADGSGQRKGVTRSSSDQRSDKTQPPQSHARPLPAAATENAVVSQYQPTSNPQALDIIDPNQTEHTQFFTPSSHYGRPPRLPLPIEEVVLPGSPIISPSDVSGPVGHESSLPRPASLLSSTTADDEDTGDDIYKPEDVGTGPAVETLIEWKEAGNRVYVTGTFAEWNKKFRLHKNGPSKDPKAMSATLPLRPGIHHLTFLVDENMRTSRHMPTTVDYGNLLVNYIEVTTDHKASRPREIENKQNQQKHLSADNRQTHSGQPRQLAVHSSTPDSRPSTGASNTPAHQGQGLPSRTSSKKAKPSTPTTLSSMTRKAPERKDYHSEIPGFLMDLDAPEDSSRFARASAVQSTQPQPPSLPMFLSKSILNGQTPLKDDASVLILPNHTVLNHLATSSIKNGVLATSATTRYRKKYVTTILYKPTSDDGD